MKQQLDNLEGLLAPYAAATEQDLRRWLIEPGTPDELAAAMHYCTEGGKRLRPCLTLMAAEACGGAETPGEAARLAAAAVEMIQCYSLVHDDLPGMDNDLLRRGRPTAHVKFGEAMAILVGDALLTRAFALLAGAGEGLAGRLAAELATASGPAGMIAGQVADMDLCRIPDALAGVEYIQLRKTAALIRGAVRMGGLCGGADERAMKALGDCGRSLGLAFQIIDDVLDVTAEAAQVGKATGKDADAGKKTYVGLLGLEQAKALGRQLTEQAVAALAPLGPAADKLRRLAWCMEQRTR